MNHFSYPLTIVQINIFEEPQNIFPNQKIPDPKLSSQPPRIFNYRVPPPGDLVEVLNYGFQHGQLSVYQRRGLLSLILKKGERDLRNWRPISLLCVDYKIDTKALAARLQKVLSSVLHEDQTCGVPGRSIFRT